MKIRSRLTFVDVVRSDREIVRVYQGLHNYPRLELTDPLVCSQLETYREMGSMSYEDRPPEEKTDVRGSDPKPAEVGTGGVADPGSGRVPDEEPDGSGSGGEVSKRRNRSGRKARKVRGTGSDEE